MIFDNKKMDKKCFPPLLVLLMDPGSRDPGWIKIRIRDKHPGSATPTFWVESERYLKLSADLWNAKCPKFSMFAMHVRFKTVLPRFL